MKTAREIFEQMRTGYTEEGMQTLLLIHIAELLENLHTKPIEMVVADERMTFDENGNLWVREVTR